MNDTFATNCMILCHFLQENFVDAFDNLDSCVLYDNIRQHYYQFSQKYIVNICKNIWYIYTVLYMKNNISIPDIFVKKICEKS